MVHEVDEGIAQTCVSLEVLREVNEVVASPEGLLVEQIQEHIPRVVVGDIPEHDRGSLRELHVAVRGGGGRRGPRGRCWRARRQGCTSSGSEGAVAPPRTGSSGGDRPGVGRLLLPLRRGRGLHHPGGHHHLLRGGIHVLRRQMPARRLGEASCRHAATRSCSSRHHRRVHVRPEARPDTRKAVRRVPMRHVRHRHASRVARMPVARHHSMLYSRVVAEHGSPVLWRHLGLCAGCHHVVVVCDVGTKAAVRLEAVCKVRIARRALAACTRGSPLATIVDHAGVTSP
mmetsp:Transcript_17851/g.47250  ORF Transcript_17851/g.47250 Transcript_17851/m.47250 type:complete len:286 (-) Transcript_17851:480-1337(-)